MVDFKSLQVKFEALFYSCILHSAIRLIDIYQATIFEDVY